MQYTISNSVCFCFLHYLPQNTERPRGRVVRAFGCGAKGRRFESRSGHKTGKLSLSSQQWMGTWLISEKVKGGERRGLGSAFHMPWPKYYGALIPLARRPLLTHSYFIWAAPSEFGTYRLCEQRRFRRACASAQSRQNLRCSLIQAVCQKEPSDRKPDPWPLWMAGHAQLKFVMTECSKTQIRLTGLI